MHAAKAVTSVGGDILFVEATRMSGDGKLTVTGQLGDVMKESARAGLTYARVHSDALGIPEEKLKDHEIHIHVPAGAVPKDGPSAGRHASRLGGSRSSHRFPNTDIRVLFVLLHSACLAGMKFHQCFQED